MYFLNKKYFYFLFIFFRDFEGPESLNEPTDSGLNLKKKFSIRQKKKEKRLLNEEVLRKEARINAITKAMKYISKVVQISLKNKFKHPILI